MATYIGNSPSNTSRPVEGASAPTPQSESAQNAVPALYPAVQPSHTVDVATGPPWFLAGDPATFVFSGNAGVATVHRELAGATGVYVVTGNSGVTRLTHSIAGATGVYTETGSASGIIVHRELLGATGVFTETGNDGLFKLVLGSTGIQYNLLGNTGAFIVAGNAGLFSLEVKQGGISGSLRRQKMYHGGNLYVQPMSEATRRAEKIMVGWRDEDEAMMLIQIIETFYD